MSLKEDESTFFVSRRGKQVGVHQVDLSGIDIESGETIPKTRVEKKPLKSKKVPKQKPVRQKKVWSKKKSLILAVIVFIVLSPIILAELVTAEYKEGPAEAKKDLNAIIQTEVLPVQKNSTITPDQLRSVANKVNAVVGEMCKGGLMDNAASIYPRAKTALVDCKSSQQRYAALASNLYELEKQTRYLSKLDSIMKPVATPITDDYAVMDAQQTTWKSAADEITKLSPPSAMKTAHSELLTSVKAASEAWAALTAANGSQNIEEFKAAEQSLNNEYDAIRSTTTSFNEVIIGAQNKVTTAYGALK